MGYDWRFDVVRESLGFLLGGLQLTVALSVLSMGASLALGLPVALARLSSWRVARGIAAAYSDFFRGTPVLVQLLWVYYSVPILTGVVFTPFVTALIALTLNITAFVSEIYRAGIQSIGRGQREAALALGMSDWQVLRRVILPQSFRRVLPPLGSTWVSLFKDTAIVSVISVSDLMYRGRALSIETYRPVETFTVVALVYFVVTYPQARGVDWLFDRLRVRG